MTKKTVGQKIDKAFDATGDVVGETVDRKINFLTVPVTINRWQAILVGVALVVAIIF